MDLEPRAQPSVIVVEDEFVVALDLRGMLERAGFRVIGPATDVAAALELVATNRVDAGLIDLNLQGQLSYAVGESLRRKGVPFCFLTGYRPSDVDEAFRSEAFLLKPVSEADLLVTLDHMLGISRPNGRR